MHGLRQIEVLPPPSYEVDVARSATLLLLVVYG